MMTEAENCVCIGVGNDCRGDDGVGLYVARLLREQCLPASARVLEQSGEGLALMEAWSSAQNVYLFDAVSSGAEAGTVVRLDAGDSEIPRGFFNYSSHAFSLAEAVEMARSLGELPRRVIIYGIEGTEFGHGMELTGPVERAAHEVVARVLEEIAGVCRTENDNA